MVTRDDLILDPWSGLSHRAILRPRDGGGNLAPTWVGSQGSRDVRRLNAYMVLAAYYENTSRVFLTDPRRAQEHREYGDAAALVDAIQAAVLGEEQTIQVDGASDDEPIAPEEPGEDATDEERAAFADAKAEHEKRLADWQAAVELQEWFDEWADNSRYQVRVHEAEQHAQQLGDGVYLVSWSGSSRRVTLRTYDPGFYFPVENDDEYPDRVHLAWEFENPDDEDRPWLRRITYERVTITEARERGVAVEETRRYPYADEDEPPSEYVTLMTDATWPLAKVKVNGRRGVDSLSYDGAVFGTNDQGDTLRDYDLGIDFVPVVHIPNTVAGAQHFGTAAVTRVAQILDDVGATDTDLQSASAIVGVPPLAVEGGNRTDFAKTYGPGTVFFGTKLDVADTSHSLDALAGYLAALLKRLSTNARVPEEVLGRVKAGDIASGIALALSFGPFRSLIGEMRLVRADKYRLMHKMVQRTAMVAGDSDASLVAPGRALTPGVPRTVTLEFGSYLPSDLKQTVDLILSLLEKHGISRATGLRLLASAGLDLGDLDEEMHRIQHEDFEGARDLADATGSEDDAREYLGLAPVEEAPAPAPAPAPQPVPPNLPQPTPPGPPVPAPGPQPQPPAQ